MKRIYFIILFKGGFKIIKSNFNTFNNENKQDLCFCPIPRIPMGSFVSMNYPNLNKGSFVSTNYSSNKVPLNFGSTDASQNFDCDENSENIEGNQIGNYKHLNDLRGIINNNDYDTNNNYMKAQADEMDSLFKYLIKHAVVKYYNGVEYVNQ